MRSFGRLFIAVGLGAILLVGLVSSVLAHDQADDVKIYVSSSSSGTVDGIEFKDEDILVYNSDTDAWAMHFDGSDPGMNGFDINAFYVDDDGNDATLDPILFSLKNARSYGTFVADDSDIVEFTPSSLGATTVGTFSLYFDGSDVGLSSNSEEIDAIAMSPDGRLVLSTSGNHSVLGVNGADEDLIVFSAGTFGANTAGTFEIYFDGSDVGLTSADEDVWGTWLDDRTGDVYLTTKDDFSVAGLSGDQENIFVFSPTSLGSNTSGTFAHFWDGDTHRFAGERIDGFSIEFLNAPPVAQDDDFTMLEDGVLNGNVLADNGNGVDSDPDGDPLTVNPTPVSGPSNGTLTLLANGNFTYTPFADYFGTDTFEYEIDDGNGETDIGLVTVTVAAVNDEPSFSAGANEVVLEDAGAQSIPGWATAISVGPANESAQTPSFTVTNDNNGLFSSQPAVDAAGTLTYTPAADANGSAIVDVTLTDSGGTANGGDDTSPTAQFAITVAAVNDAPSFTAGADEVVLEDAGAQTVNGWATAISAGPADEAGQTLAFTVTNDNNGLFVAQPSVDPTTGDLTYTPADDANGAATVAVFVMDDGGTANGGDDSSPTQQFTITVAAVNDEPSFTAGADEVVLEDAGAQSIAGWATAISAGPANESAQTPSFTVTNDNNGLFSSQPVVDAAGTLTYTPADDANGAATVDVFVMDDGGTANGGDNTSPTQQFTITVAAVNDEPSFTAGANEVVLEDPGAQSVAGWATAISAGPADEAGQILTFTVTNDNNGLFAGQPSVDPNTGDLTYTPADDANGAATVDVFVMDDGGTANGGDDTSPTQQFTITVTAVNDAPVVTPSGAMNTHAVGDPAVVIDGAITVSDIDDTNLVSAAITLTNRPDGDAFESLAVNTGGTSITAGVYNAATGVLSLSGSDTVANYQQVLQTTTYLNTDTTLDETDRIVEFIVNDGTDDSNTGSVTVEVANNQAPEIIGGATANVSVAENETAVTDVDTADDNDSEGAGLAYSLTTTIDGIDNGFFTIDPGTGVLAFTSAPDFENPIDSDLDNNYEVEVTVTDSGPGPNLSDTQNITVSVTDVNEIPDVDIEKLTNGLQADDPNGTDVPVLAPSAAVTWTYEVTNTGVVPVAAIDVTVTDSDPGVTPVFTGGDDGDGILEPGETWIYTALGTALDLTVPPPPGTTVVSGCANLPNPGDPQRATYENVGTVVVPGNSDSDPSHYCNVIPLPVATPDGYNSLGNVGINVPAGPGLISNDIGGPGLVVSEVQGLPGNVGVATPTANGGTVTVGSDGSVAYTPPAGFEGNDSFTYAIDGPGGTSLPGTVTINVADVIWFVDNALGAAGNGTLATPFNTLAGFEAINGNGGATDPGAGDIVILYSGSGNYTGGVTLENSQFLIGQGASADIPTITGISEPTHSLALPTTGGTRPTIVDAGGDAISVVTGNTIRGLNISDVPVANHRLAGTSVGTLTISEVDALSGTGGIIEVTTGGTLAVTLDGATSTSSSGAAAIDINGVGGTFGVTGATSISAATGGGVDLTSNSGATFTFASLAITTTGGTGFNANGSGTVSIGGTTNSIASTAGTSLSAVNTTIGGGGWTFASINNDQGASGGDTSAIILTNTGTGTFTVNGGTIDNITDVDGIRLSQTDGLVSLTNMTIEDIAASSDAAAPIRTRSGVDGIHGQQVDGGLKLDNVMMRRFSDNAVNGSLFSGAGTTSFVGLEIRNSTFQDSNRFHVAARGDDNGEGMVRIEGLSGSVVIEDSTFERGGELLDIFTATSGSVDITIESNSFLDGYKEFTSGPTRNVGKLGVDITIQGTADAVVRFGGTTAAQGNTVRNGMVGSLRVLQETAASGNVDVLVANNTLVVTDHSTAQLAPGNFIFDFPQGGVQLQSGAGTYEGLVEDNLFDEVMNAEGRDGQLSLIMDGAGTETEFIVRRNTFNLPWQAPVDVLADGNTKANVLFDGNTYVDGFVGSASDDLGAPSISPFRPWKMNVANGGVLDMTIRNEVLPPHDLTSGFAASFDASMNSSGGTLNLWLENNDSPYGYNLANFGSGTFQLYQDASASTVPAAIVSDNSNRGGGGSDTTTPPTVTTSGTIGATGTAPTQPSITIL